jgi:hypothetical protein
MRCTRCDRPAVPQAVGFLADGLLVFGWCVKCLEETACRDVVVAHRSRPAAFTTGRLSQPRPLLIRPMSQEPGPARRLLASHRKVVAAVGLVLALWGFGMLAFGLILRSRFDPRTASPLGNGTPALLIGGGGSSAAVGLALWGVVSGGVLLRSRLALKVVQGLMCALLLGVAIRYPRGDPIVVEVASVAVAVSAAARWLELRRKRAVLW